MRECKQFFDLLVGLVTEYISQLTAEEQSPVLERCEVDLFELLGEVIAKLKEHQCKEAHGGILEDKAQIGYMQTIEVSLSLDYTL